MHSHRVRAMYALLPGAAWRMTPESMVLHSGTIVCNGAFDPEKPASLQMTLSLGAPLAQPRKDQLNQLLPGRFHELYGLIEGFLTIPDKTEAVRKAGSVGCPPPFREMRDPCWAGHASRI